MFLKVIFIFTLSVSFKWFWKSWNLILFFPVFPFDPPKNIRKPLVFWCFQWDQKGILGSEGLIYRLFDCSSYDKFYERWGALLSNYDNHGVVPFFFVFTFYDSCGLYLFFLLLFLFFIFSSSFFLFLAICEPVVLLWCLRARYSSCFWYISRRFTKSFGGKL